MAVVQKIRCRIERIIDHGERVYTVHLLPEKRVTVYKPGQFLHLALDEYDPTSFWPESRIFSIASSSIQRERLIITYSVRGRFTERMERELVEGKIVWVKLPYGEFIIQGTGDVVLFAGGTGMTAFTAFLEGLEPEVTYNVYLAYGARNPDLLIYRDLVQQCSEMVSRFNPFYFVEQQNANRESMVLSETVGQLSVELMWQHICDPMAATYYISGPPAMLNTISNDLIERCIPSDAIRIDAWE